MSDSPAKLVLMAKRQDHLTFDQFQNYYEETHSKLVTHLPRVRRYFRRYLHPVIGGEAARDFDVIVEFWFDSQDDLEFGLARLADPEVAAVLAEDEEKFIERSRSRIFVVDESESDLTVDVPAED